MSQPSRPQGHGPAQRRRRSHMIEAVQPLEDRCLLAPVLAISPIVAATSPAPGTPPANTSQTNVTVTIGQADPGFLTAAPFDSVSQLTPASSFGGDIVRIRSGPGGPFGNDVYAVSRGAGENSPAATATQQNFFNLAVNPPTVKVAVNRPGVIYRVDPATGNTNVFFDLNTVITQFEPAAKKATTTAGNTAGAETGLVNTYDITFDPEGYFDGKPSMFVSSVDRLDPAKNAIFRIAPDGSFMGVFAQFSSGVTAGRLNINPSAILVPPPEDQSFLRGLLAGGGVNSTNTQGSMVGLFFDANAYSPGKVLSTPFLPTGVAPVAGLSNGPLTGLTAANPDYFSRIYGTYTDFGTPAGPGLPATPGLSGIEGINGDTLLGRTFTSTTTGGTAGTLVTAPRGIISQTPVPTGAANTVADSTVVDRYAQVTSDFRRYQDIGFDQYGYFAQGAQLGGGNTTVTGVSSNGSGSVGGTGPGGGSGTGIGTVSPTATYSLITSTLNINGRPAVTLPPASAGNLFVADLASGLSVTVPVPAPPAPVKGAPAPVAQSIRVPVQGPEIVSIDNSAPNTDLTNFNNPTITVTPTDVGLGGRIVRITPNGVLRTFAYNFHTTNATDSSGFALSSLSLTFSADGTTLYVADDDGIWQFKTVASLAGATSGSLVGLNDLRSLGVPYDGKGSAVAVIDTGVDAISAPFRGRVAPGTNVFLGGPGNDDTAVFGTFAANLNGGGNVSGGGGGNATQPAPLPSTDGHGTPVAGVVAQFVPQATIVPVNIFAPFLSPGSSTTATATNGGATLISANANALSDSNLLYQGLDYVAKHPFVNDPVRPGTVSRVIATTMGFGSTTTFDSEGSAFKLFPQVFISLKSEMQKFRALGIAPIAAAGQFGKPFASGLTTGTNNGGNNNNNNATLSTGNNNAENGSVGDIAGIALPAILNEVVSVTGSYSYPFSTGPGASPANPTDFNQPIGIAGHQYGPVLVFGNALTLGGGAVTTGGGTSNGNGAAALTSLPGLLANADTSQYVDRILGSVNRGVTTDYAAPAIDVPTFRRTYLGTTTASGTTSTTTGQDSTDHNGFNNAGTSLSAAEVTGAFALVSSALGYWSNLAKTGYTADAYLTQPVGVRSLNFGKHTLMDLTAWNNPDGINAILQWTAVPATSANDATSASTPRQLFGSTQYPAYSRISVSNAIAAIEGYEAVNYLINVGALSKLDASGNGIISNVELQTFVDTAAAKGMPTVGAMARLLGGTARISTNGAQSTLFGEDPDQPDVLQRRFNFFDYSADGVLNGSVTIPEYKLLATKLLPAPDQFQINNRQKSSVNGYLVAPATLRNYNALLHIQPGYQFVDTNKALFRKYRNTSPAKFHVARGVTPSTSTFPVFTLFEPTNAAAGAAAGSNGSGASNVSGGSNASGNGSGSTTPQPVTQNSATGTASTGTASTGTASTGTASTGTASTGTASTGNTNSGTASTGAVLTSTSSGGSTTAATGNNAVVPQSQVTTTNYTTYSPANPGGYQTSVASNTRIVQAPRLAGTVAGATTTHKVVTTGVTTTANSPFTSVLKKLGINLNTKKV